MSKMAGNFKVGDLVWAKMKGFPNWPGKVIAPKPEVKRPANKKNQQFVFFFGSENYAWIQEENLHIYADNRNKFMLSQRIPRGYKEAIEAIEDALKAQPDVNLKTSDLPSIEDELAQIFPLRKETPLKDYSRDSGRKRKKSPSPHPVPSKTKTIKDRRSSAPVTSTRDQRRSSQDDQKKIGKNNGSGGRSGRETTLTGKETTKTKKFERGATPKAVAKSAKALQKSVKKVRKVKPLPKTEPIAGKNETAEQELNLPSDSASSKSKVEDTNHKEDSLEGEFGAEDEASLTEMQEEDSVSLMEPQEDEMSLSEPPTDEVSIQNMSEADTQEKSEQRTESPEIFTSEDLETCSSHNGPQQIEDKPPEEMSSEIISEVKVITDNSVSIDTSEVVLTQEEATVTKEPSSARGENIFEMFSQKDSAVMYQHEEIIDEDEDEKMADDGVEYAVVTVDPDGQAHVLLNAETIIDDDVLVLGQEEEVETEGVETDTLTEEPLETEIVETEQLETKIVETIDGPDKVLDLQQDEVMNRESGEKDSEQVLIQESIDIKTDTAESVDQPPTVGQLSFEEELDQLEQTNGDIYLETEQAQSLSTKAVPGLADAMCTDQITPHNSTEKAEIVNDKLETVATSQGNNSEGKVTESETNSDKEVKSETEGSAKVEGEAQTPQRRSTRVKKSKEEASVKTKREESRSIAARLERKLNKDTPKTLGVRRQSGKRPGSPASTPVSKRGKLLNKTPSSPGRSVAPAEYKPLGGLPPETIEPAVAGPAKQDIIPTPLKIGFLGLGIMGTGMVDNLLKSGHEVTVWNRTAQKCREFMKEGALKGNTPAEVVAACDITFSCVSDPAAVKDLVFGNCGVLQGIQPGKGYVEMSTIDPDTVADVQEAVTSQGGRFLEAPVVGSRSPAAMGQLVILAAGDRVLYEDCYSCFEAMGKKTFFLGETTSGCKMKLVVNMLMGTIVAGLAESLALADKVGLDQDALLQILDLSVMSSPLIRSKGQSIMMSRFEPQFPLQHQQKDLRLSINMADSVDQPLHVATAVNELFKKAKAKGYSQHDMCAVYRAADM